MDEDKNILYIISSKYVSIESRNISITINNIPVNKIKIDILSLIFNNSATFRVRYITNYI